MADHPSALYETSVVQVESRSAKVNLPEGRVSDWVAFSHIQRHVGILGIAVGDLMTETALIDPLSKSVLQFCRLLIPDDSVRFFKIRSLKELEKVWNDNQALFSHVILMGHSDGFAIRFAVDGDADVNKLHSILQNSTTEKTYISLCCKTGYADFGKRFSQIPYCNALVAPFHSVHGAVASQFVQTLLTYALLQGETARVAFRHSRNSVAGSSSFRFWQQGQLTTGCQR